MSQEQLDKEQPEKRLKIVPESPSVALSNDKFGITQQRAPALSLLQDSTGHPGAPLRGLQLHQQGDVERKWS